jgi:site-specific DNA recombinase
MKNLKGKRAILYRRVSTTKQKETGNSLNSQKDQLRSFCYNKEIQIIQEFEEDFSAKDFNRPEWNKLNKYAKANYREIDLLLVVNWDRFSRNTLEALNTIDTFSKINIEVNSINNWIDYQDPTQKFIQLMYLGMPEVDNKMKGLRIKKAMREVRKSGRWCSKQPFGYLPGKDHFGKALMKVDPDKGQLLKSLFELYSSGNYSQSEILKMTSFKPLKLSKSNISRILQNIVYAGFLDVPAFEEEPKQTKKGLHEPIIDLITFNKIQELFKVRSAQKQKPKAFNKKLLLRGHLRCSKCGGNLTGSASTSKTGKKYYYYHCSSKRSCNERFRAELANSKFEDYLKQFDIRPEVKRLFVEILKKQF